MWTLPLQAVEFEAPRQVSEFSSSYRQILPADLDADGDPDLVALGWQTVSWYRNVGGEFFDRIGSTDYVAEAMEVNLADFDGDGLPDLLLHSQAYDGQGNPTSLKILFGAGMTGFGPRQLSLTGLSERFLAADVDNNGLADLIGPATTYLNPGGATPVTVNRTPQGERMDSRDAVQRDVTGDGLPDFFTRYGDYWENLGGGNFSDQKTIAITPVAGRRTYGMDFISDPRLPGGRALVALMINEDSRNKAELVLHAQDGNGSWAAVDAVKITPQARKVSEWWALPRSEPGTLLGNFGTVSRDGIVDDMRTVLLSLTFQGNKPSLVVKTLAATGTNSTAASLYLDVNNDERKELVTAGNAYYAPEGSYLEIRRGLATGGVERKPRMIDAPGHGDIVKQLVDLDGDGDLDLIAEGDREDQMKGQIAWWENRNRGASFIRHVLMNKSGNMTLVAAKDLDGDEKVEVIAGYHPYKDGQSRQVLISELARNGKRLLRTLRGPERGIQYPGLVQLGDWDGNSVDDLVMWDYVSLKGIPGSSVPAVRWMKGLPKHRFAKPLSLGESEDEVLYDVDGDGDLDLTGYSELEFAGDGWRENTGDGESPLGHEFPEIPGLTAPLSPAGADLDGDGRLDFVSGATPVLAKAGGVFQALPALATLVAGDKAQLWFADVDGDGHADGILRITGYTGTRISLFRNQGTATFEAPVLLQSLQATEWEKVTVLAGDIDDDGKTDLVLSSQGNRSRIEWFKGK
ncbi:FG-GAP repeat domain-containing protein [Luteolibacter sp. Populi]|uniref:FG-GAP repeat domain-containing protein n=1 Tax=Luteolibacter sp. Populi TaxID=3230487 RepID=UPI0034665BF7